MIIQTENAGVLGPFENVFESDDSLIGVNGESKVVFCFSVIGAYEILDQPMPALAPISPALAPVLRLQARLELIGLGKWALIQPVIDAMSDPDKSVAQAYFDDSLYWHRSDPFVAQIGNAIGMSSDDIDAAFISAAAR